MINLIKQIDEMGLTTVIMGFTVACFFALGVVSLKDDIFKKFGILTKKSLKETEVDKKLSDTEQKMKQLETDFANLQKELNKKQVTYNERLDNVRTELSEQLQKINNTLDAFMKRSDENTVASFRSALWRMHKDFVAQDFVTPDGLKTFLEMGAIYERSGGDDIYHEKLLPEVESLEIKYPPGGIYNSNKI